MLLRNVVVSTPNLVARWHGGTVARWHGGTVVRWCGGTVVGLGPYAELDDGGIDLTWIMKGTCFIRAWARTQDSVRASRGCFVCNNT